MTIGCDEVAHPEEEGAKPIPISTNFDQTRVGAISGQVVWSGPVPQAPPLNIALPLPGGRTEARTIPNPNLPKINAQNGGVPGAVVYLEQVDPERSKPWDYPQVHVELYAQSLRLLQGQTPAPVGFVRQGDEIEIVSREAVMQSLCARGVSFFTLAFPEPERPLQRRLDRDGLVELSSGMGHYWWRGYLFVCQHPYFTWTDADGRFTLTRVPAGDLRVVCWMPNSKVARTERDPNTIGILRIVFDKPLERAIPIRLEAGDAKQMQIQMTRE